MNADVAQLAEQLICNQQVIGSSPIIGFLDLQLSWLEQPAHNRSVLGSSPRRSIRIIYGPVAQLVRAPPCHGGGRRFKSVLGRLHSYLTMYENIVSHLGSQLSWESICLTSRGSQVRALQAPFPLFTLLFMCRSGGTGRRPGLKIPWVEIPVPVRSRSTAERKTLDFQGFFHVQHLRPTSRTSQNHPPFPLKIDFDSRFDSRIDSRSLKIRLWKAGKSPL